MRILFLGDVNCRYLHQWVRYMQKRDYEIAILSFQPGNLDGVKVYHLDSDHPILNRQHQLLHHLRASFLEWLRIKAGKFDIVHVHLMISGLTTWLATAHHNTIISVWGIDNPSYDLFNKKENGWYTKHALARASMVTVPHSVFENKLRRFVSNTKHIEVIPLGVDLGRFSKINRIGSGEGNVRFCYAKPVEERCGVEIVLSAFIEIADKHPNTTLVLVGSGHPDYIDNLKAIAWNARLYKRVHFTGEVTAAEYDAHLKHSDVFIQPSLQDAFEIGTLEAMVAGLPVITSRTGCNQDFVIDEVTGFTVPPGDVQALSEMMINMIEDEESRVQMGWNARELVNRLYGFNMHAARMESIYKDIAKI